MQDVTVIGGGPAGISAAIYSARKGLKVTLIAEKMGGQVAETLESRIWIPFRAQLEQNSPNQCKITKRLPCKPQGASKSYSNQQS